METATDLLAQLRAHDFRIGLAEDRTQLLIGPADRLTDALRAAIRDHRDALIMLLSTDQPAPAAPGSDPSSLQYSIGEQNEQNEQIHFEHESGPDADEQKTNKFEPTPLVALLRRLRRAGVRLRRTEDGGTLYANPREAVSAEDAAAIRRLKSEVLDYVTERELFGRSEVAWRLEPMRRQIPTKGAIPFLRAKQPPRGQATWRLEECQSCGKPLALDPEGDRDSGGRCGNCAEAAREALAERRPDDPLESVCWCGREVYRYADEGTPYCVDHARSIGGPETPARTQRQDPIRVTIWADGLCEPTNPGGWACWAWLARDDEGDVIASDRGCIGHGPEMTNNRAEYRAVIEALRWAARERIERPKLVTDSQLVVMQVSGTWQIGAAHLIGPAEEARVLLWDLHGTLDWIPRERNTDADALSRRAYAESQSRGADCASSAD